MGAQAQPHVEGVNNVFSNQLWIYVLVETWITLDDLYEAILCFLVVFYVLKQVSSYFSC